MTEPKKPDPNNLAGIDLPILTEVDDGQVDIPDFDFSSELDQMSSSLSTPEMPLEFPPELLEEDRAAQPGDAPINLQDLPSLDLGDEAAPDATKQTDHEFEFELEPLQAAAPADSGLDALMARAQFDEPGQPAAVQPADDLGVQIPELTLDDVLPEPSSSDTLGTSPTVGAPTLVDAMFDQGEMAEDDGAIPELTLDEVLEAPSAAPQTAAADIPELTLEAALAEGSDPAPVPEVDDIPELTLDDVLAEEPVLREPPAPDASAIPELTLEAALTGEQNEAAAPVDAAAIPDLSLDDVLAVEATQAAPAESDVDAIPELSIDDVLPASDPVATGEDNVTEPVAEALMAEATVAAPALDLPAADMPEVASADAMPEPEVVADVVDTPLPDIAGADEVTESVTEDVMAPQRVEEGETGAEPALLSPDEQSGADEPLAEDTPGPAAEDQAVDALVAAALPMDMAAEAEQAEAVQEALSEAQDELTQDAAAIDSATGEPAAFRSIPLDSLPHGVLGGGKGPSAEPEATEAESELSLQDKIRAAERTLAQERLRQAMAQAREEAMQSWQPAVAEPEAEPAPRVAATDYVPQLADTGRPVEIINVAGLASSPTPQPFNLPPVRKSYVTLVDEAMLIDSLYDKIMPRMKVELSLWLQDALDHQAKQMLSGVMHQLKEDYEMLFSETLRESLRQAIAEMGREDRGERY
ncbi:hypothetical protein THUN1379_05640 [Paludibacterium sp. THUN1379]|uniref:hypothetical protein n=1 Tax=Paludibacterium sp. THUN1379 TaxID=3112107 RepID=UPI003085F696|nr:hypothetical protein THUN1379_05640 [Paludibacterium sp. THUN1379]